MYPIIVALTCSIITILDTHGMAGKPQTQEVVFPARDFKLAGTMLIPDHPGPCPAVVLISGGGPHDRDGSYGDFKPMKMLAEHLGKLGFVTLRYDDPGVGESGGKDVMQYLMDDYVAFVSSAVLVLRKSPQVDPSRVGLLGLSQGASVAAEVAAVDSKISFVALLSGHAVPGKNLFLRYQRYLDRQAKKAKKQMEEIECAQNALFDCLEQGTDCSRVESQIKLLIKREFEELSSEQKKPFSSVDEYRQTTFLGATLTIAHTPNFLEILDYSILPALGNVRCPVFIVFGEREEFVEIDKNLGMMEAKLKSTGNQAFATEIIPNATHLFLDADNPSNDFATGLRFSLTKWLNQLRDADE